MLLVSSELDEVLALADRIAVMYRGKMLATLPADAPRERIGLLMAGVTDAASAPSRPPGRRPEPHCSTPTSPPVQLPRTARDRRRSTGRPERIPQARRADPAQPGPGTPSGATPPSATQGRPCFEAQLHGRVLREMTSANTVTVTILAIFLALVVGAILIVRLRPATCSASTATSSARRGPCSATAGQRSPTRTRTCSRAPIFDPATITGAIDGSDTWSQVFDPLSETLTDAAPLIFTGLAVALAFRGGLFNIGAQGQADHRRASAVRLVGFELHLPSGLHLIAALLGAADRRCAVGRSSPASLKARTGAHEVIVTIMLNYIALLLPDLADQPEGRTQPDALGRDQQERRRTRATAHDSGVRAGAGTSASCSGCWPRSRLSAGC